MTHPPGHNPYDNIEGRIDDVDDDVADTGKTFPPPSQPPSLPEPSAVLSRTVPKLGESAPIRPTLAKVAAVAPEAPTGDEPPDETDGDIDEAADENVEIPDLPIEEDPSKAVIFGLSGSGKTSVLRAIKHACDHDPEDEERNLTLHFFPEGPTSRLHQEAVDFIRRDSDEIGTEEVFNYPFRLSFEENVWGFPIKDSMYMEVSDGPGGALFPVGAVKHDDSTLAIKYRPLLIDAAKEARVLVLLIDASDSEQLNDVIQFMPGILSDMATNAVRFRYVRSKIGHWLNKKLMQLIHPEASMSDWVRTRELKADRFLILLNKIDILCQGWADASRDSRLKPETVANVLDPVKQAKELLQVGFLKEVHQYLKPGAKLAVGITSARGFYNDGLVFDREHLPDAKKRMSVGINAWRPYGLRDALYFYFNRSGAGTCRAHQRR